MSPAVPGLCFFIFVVSAALGQTVRDEESEQHFRKWLDEDVRFIINPEEKTVFRGLSTPEEKERFIEQFWLRRDPDPKTSINEFKEEHYRRIAYANERFKAGRDGWLTDRGRIYIVFGPPAHIEMHPMGGLHNRSLSEGGGSTVTFPYEVWTYRYIEGLGNDILFEFVDSGMNGNYRLALSPDEKDALLMTGYGLTMEEFFGSRTRLDRVRQQGILRPLDHISLGINKSNLQLIEDYFKALTPPNIKYKDLQKLVGTRVHYEELPIGTRASIVWVNAEQFMVPATLQVWNRLLTYQPENDIRRARVEIYNFSVDSATGEADLKIPLRVLDRNGRVVQEIRLDHVGLTYLGERASASTHLYIDGVGDYRAEISIEDLISGRKKDMSVRFRIQDSSG